MGSLSDPVTIDRVQHFGKLISGFAVTLLFWPWFLNRTRRIWTFLGLILGTYLIVGFVYNLEGRMINHLANKSSDAQKNAAYIGNLMHETLISNQIEGNTLNGLWTPDISQSASGKAFAGISAFIISSSETATKESLKIIPKHLQKTDSNQVKLAYEAMIAPVFALSLSLIGMMVHSCRLLYLFLHNTTGFYVRKPILKLLIMMMLIVAVLVSASLTIKTPLTSHETYVNWVKHGEIKDISNNAHKVAIGFALDSVIKSQAITYPVFNQIRKFFEPVFDTSYGRQTLEFLNKRKKRAEKPE